MRGQPGIAQESVDYDQKIDDTDVSASEDLPTKIRSLFPETWLWDIVSVKWVGLLQQYLTLKAPNKNCSRPHFNFLLLSFEENKA